MGIHLLAFVGIAVLVIVLPGPDTMVVTKNALLHGRTAALGTSLGVNAGLVTWTVCTALGLAALVRQSEIAFTALKLIGALYLVWLGVAALRASRRGSDLGPGAPSGRGAPMGAAGGFRQGLLSNLGNPKIAIFFTSLLPQFVNSRDATLGPFLLLGGVFVLMTTAWLCGYALMAARASAVLTRPAVKTALDRFTGVVLIAVGIRLALERR